MPMYCERCKRIIEAEETVGLPEEAFAGEEEQDVYKLDGMNRDELILYRKKLRETLRSIMNREETLRDIIDEVDYMIEDLEE